MMNNQDFLYSYFNFLTINFSINEPEIEEIEEFKKGLKTNIGTDVSYSESLQKLFVDVLISAESEEKEIEVFRLHTRHIFELDNIDHLINKNILSLSDESIIMFVSIAYSTTRGVLKSKLADSRFNEYVLPIIDPKKLAPESPIPIISDKPKKQGQSQESGDNG